MSPLNPFATQWPVIVVGALAFICIAGYTLFVASPYLTGPTLTVVTPRDNDTVTSPTVTISGRTERVSYLSVNDLPVPLLEDGAFLVERSFPPGYTVVVLKARDRFGRELVSTIRFLNTYNPPRHGTQEESGVKADTESN